MIKNYCITAWRNLTRNKAFGIINVLGLAVSTAVCLLIILIINDQKSYDNFIPHYDRIYRIHTKGRDENARMMATSAYPLAQNLRQSNDVQAAAVLFRNPGGDLYYKDKSAPNAAGYYTDSDFFSVLDIKLKEGDAARALERPRTIVISEKTARQLFGDQDAMGKLITLSHTGVVPGGADASPAGSTYGQFEVTGVLQKNPGKTTLPFDMLLSLSSVDGRVKDSLLQQAPEGWDDVWTCYTYVLLKKGSNRSGLQVALNSIAAKKYPTEKGSDFSLEAQPLKDIPGDLVANATATTLPGAILIILAILCLVIMLSACLNYTNLSVARSLSRVKEVGVRKVSGATRRQIFQQFIFESVFTSLLALLFALALLRLLQPLLSGLWLNRFFHFSFQYTPRVYLAFLGFSLLSGLLAGLLPAAYICYFNPVQIFRRLNQIKGFRGLTLRKILLVTQFVVSLLFVVSASLIYEQTAFVLNFNYGFNQKNVVNIKLYKDGNYERFAHAISSNRNVEAVSACTFPPSTGSNNSMWVYKAFNRQDSLQTGVIDIDGKCLRVWGIHLLAGKNLPQIAADSMDREVLINQKMAGALGYRSASAAVGQNLWLGDHTAEIVGVVQNFQYLEVTQDIEPLLLRNRKTEFAYATVRIAPGHEGATLRFLESTWKTVNPYTKFDYVFFDDQLQQFHDMLSDAASIVGFLAVIAVVISCLGLLGMALYTAQSRRKEVGIRKVLGSDVLRIVFLLSKSYLAMLGIAVVIALPAAIVLNTAWLQFFASRIRIGPLVLILSATGLSAISLFIVGLQAWNVSRQNPVRSLRTE